MKVNLQTDGGSRGNPGSGAAGVIIQTGQSKHQFGFYLGEVTNNQAEYQALIIGFRLIKKLFRNSTIEQIQVKIDSELIVKQINGTYRVRDENLKQLFLRLQSLISQFPVVQFSHVPRLENQSADQLVNLVLDTHQTLCQ